MRPRPPPKGIIKSIHHRNTRSSNAFPSDHNFVVWGFDDANEISTHKTLSGWRVVESFPFWYHPSSNKKKLFFSLWSHDHFHQEIYFLIHSRKESLAYVSSRFSQKPNELFLLFFFSRIWNKTPVESAKMVIFLNGLFIIILQCCI